MVLIKHVTIQNAERTHHKKISECKAAYTVHVSLSNVPDRVWKHYFYKQWLKMFLKRKWIKLVDSEIRLLLTKNEDIQSYIDKIKNTIKTTNKLVEIQNKRTELEAL